MKKAGNGVAQTIVFPNGVWERGKEFFMGEGNGTDPSTLLGMTESKNRSIPLIPSFRQKNI
jgi:hypothetical protein